jgi:hypothetical protein
MHETYRVEIDEVVSGYFFIEEQKIMPENVLHSAWFKMRNYFTHNGE